jgi:hypothetical protein
MAIKSELGECREVDERPILRRLEGRRFGLPVGSIFVFEKSKLDPISQNMCGVD